MKEPKSLRSRLNVLYFLLKRKHGKYYRLLLSSVNDAVVMLIYRSTSIDSDSVIIRLRDASPNCRKWTYDVVGHDPVIVEQTESTIRHYLSDMIDYYCDPVSDCESNQDPEP
jgi:hypothetical protein